MRSNLDQKSKSLCHLTVLFGMLFLPYTILRAQVPQLINYQGRVAVSGVNFNGSGQFKFALVNGQGTTSYWSNNGTSAAGSAPTAAVTLPVTNGLYSVLLGDATLANMTVIPATVFNNTDVRLRVWFNDGTHGFQLLTPDQRIAAVGYAMMAGNAATAATVADGAITSAKIAAGAVGSSQLASGSVGATQLASGAAVANLTASNQSAVPSGGMILSSTSNDTKLTNAGYVKLGKVELGDAWERRAGGVEPSAREGCSAVWTGSELIVWGGTNNGVYFSDGARYDPAVNSWVPVSATGAPSPRQAHTAVWTGKEMIVWGGSGIDAPSGGCRYNPSTNTWAPVNTANAPAARGRHSAVWTGTYMLVWGGSNINGIDLTDGGRYDPTSDSWSPTNTTSAPTGRMNQTAIWTGTEMIVWGGMKFDGTLQYLNDGKRYNPATDTWAVVNATGAPAARNGHSAVWTGTDMIVWGGLGASIFGNGARFNPTTNAWTAVSATNAPGARYGHNAAWTGTEMIVWGGGNGNGGELNTGARYNPVANTWATINTANAPAARLYHSGLWTGTEMIVWGGADIDETFNFRFLAGGGRYNPTTNSWTGPTNGGAPSSRNTHSAVWTGTEMIVWGGWNGTYLNDGGRYLPASNSWVPITTTGAPSARGYHRAVWSGSQMIVWGGQDDNTELNTGGRYNPASNSWSPTTTVGAPSKRRNHVAVWTGAEMIVHGGIIQSSVPLGDCRRYNPTTDSWTLASSTNAPSGRAWHTAVWTGSEMIVWGGGSTEPGFRTNTGGSYNPATNAWSALTLTNAPEPRGDHVAVWTGTEMIVWGGYKQDSTGYLNTGGRYAPSNQTWLDVPTIDAPLPRRDPVAVWTGEEFIVMGGFAWGVTNGRGDTGRYNPRANSWNALPSDGPVMGYGETAVWIGSEMITFPAMFSYKPKHELYLYQRQ